MDEQMVQDSGVNGADAAGQQMGSEENIETGQPKTETGVDNAQDAAAGGMDDRAEQAFARKLAAERTKIEGQFAPYRQLVERTAAQYQMTPEQYIETINGQMKAKERQEFQQKYNMTPEEFQGLVDKHPVVQQAQQYLTRASEQAEIDADKDRFFQRFPDVTMDQVPKQVWGLMARAEKSGQRISLLHAYLEVMHEQQVSQAKNQGEQEAIRKLRRNAQTTPGALGGGGADTGATSIGKMPQKDFDSLVESVLRGERKSI